MITIYYSHDTQASSITLKLFDGVTLVATVPLEPVAGDRPFVWRGELDTAPEKSTLDFQIYENGRPTPAAWGMQTGLINAATLWIGSGAIDGNVIVRAFTAAALAQLAGTQINITVPAVSGGRLTQPLVRGDSYSAALGSSLDFSRSDFPDLPEGATATLTAQRICENADGVPTVTRFVVSGEQASIPEPTGVKVVRFEPTAEQTLLWEPGEYEFDVKITFPGGQRRTFRGPDIFLTVLDQVTQ